MLHNCCSADKHCLEISETVKDFNLDVIFLTETWLNDASMLYPFYYTHSTPFCSVIENTDKMGG